MCPLNSECTQSHVEKQPVDLLISDGWVLTMDEQGRWFHPGSIAICQGKIVDIGPSHEVDRRVQPCQRLLASRHLVMPGLINLHCHASNSLIRGLGRDLALRDWLQKVCWRYMAYADEEDLYHAVLLSALEMLLNGITTFADMWTGVGIAAQAVAVSGQRAVLAHNIKDFGDAQRGEDELRTALEAWEKWHGFAAGRVQVGLGPHSVYTCRPELLRQCADLSERHNLLIQIHASETEGEVEECQKVFGNSPIEHLQAAGLLTPRTIIAHAVHLSEGDLRLVAGSGASIAHNVISNLKLASGIAPIYRYLRAGICVGLGTDGAGSNDSLDLLRDLKTAVLVQKALARDATALPTMTALSLVTRNGAQALGLREQLGSLEVGKQADLMMVDLDQPHLLPRDEADMGNMLSLLVYCASGADVDHVLVAGQVLVAYRQPLHLDREEIMHNAQRSRAKIASLLRENAS